jgi:uncharacterized membrane protein
MARIHDTGPGHSPGLPFLWGAHHAGSADKRPPSACPSRNHSGDTIVTSSDILAINVGGAIIPVILSIYLLSKNGLWGRGLIATFCIAAICHGLAQPVRGVGIGLPIFVPPLAAAFVAAIISWRHAAPLAYAGGSLGVLIGADLLNLDKLRGLGTPVLSIGGAGTFDGIFVTGIMAVLLAGLSGGRASRRR